MKHIDEMEVEELDHLHQNMKQVWQRSEISDEALKEFTTELQIVIDEKINKNSKGNWVRNYELGFIGCTVCDVNNLFNPRCQCKCDKL